MSKLIGWIIGAIICIAILLWLVKATTGIDVYENVKNDERPFMEQVGSGLKNVNKDFQRGLGTDTLVVDTLKTK